MPTLIAANSTDWMMTGMLNPAMPPRGKNA